MLNASARWIPIKALQHTRFLHLLPVHSPELSELISNMHSLEEVTIQFGMFALDPHVRHLCDAVLAHENTVRVHAIFNLCHESMFIRHLGRFQSDWASFKKLQVESIIVKYEDEAHLFPEWFFNMMAGFKSLKRLKILCPKGGGDELVNRKVNKLLKGQWPLGRVVSMLDQFAGLETLELSMRPETFAWPEKLHLHTLKIQLWMCTFPGTAQTFESVRFLELYGLSTNARITPPFHNLVTLALVFCSNVEALLEHFFKSNEKLVNLHMNCCSSVAMKFVSPHLPRVQRLEILNCPKLKFQDLLTHATDVCQFIYMPNRQITEAVLPMKWLVKTVRARKLSPRLRRITLLTMCALNPPNENRMPPLAKCMYKDTPACVIRELLRWSRPDDAIRKVVAPVCTQNILNDLTLVIDIAAIEDAICMPRPSRKRKA